MKFYKLTLNELKNELETDFESGISEVQAQTRIKKDGINFMSRTETGIKMSAFYRVLLLTAIAALVFPAAFIFVRSPGFFADFAVMLIVGVLSLTAVLLLCRSQAKKTSRISYNDFKTLRVLRDGVCKDICYKNITYGDIVYLKKGDYVPFDARILESDKLELDETEITGNAHALKFSSEIYEDNLDVKYQTNMVFCSSVVTRGTAKVAVTDISNRVYLKKSLKLTSRNSPVAVKVKDFSRLLLLLLLCLCIVFWGVSCLISKDLIAFISGALILAAAFTSDFVSAYIRFSFSHTYHNLYKKNIYLKSISVMDNLNKADILLLKHNTVFDKSAAISGFINERGEYRQLSQVNKSNFMVFLYSCFCNDFIGESSPFHPLKKLAPKVLKGVGVDYSEIRTMCPVISHYSDKSFEYDMSGIVYDGSNVLIVRGEFRSVLSMCTMDSTDKYADALERLNRTSTEIVAVAVKQVEIIEDDLSEQIDGFRLMGFIGLNRHISKSAVTTLKHLDDCGLKSVILFPGNELSARQFAGSAELSEGSYSDFKDGKVRDFDVVYDFDETAELAAQQCINCGLSPVYIGSKHKSDPKSICAEQCCQSSSRFTDIFCNFPVKSISEAVIKSKSVYSRISDLLVNTISFTLLFSLGGTLFSSLYRTVMFTPVNLLYTLLFAIPFTAFISLLFSENGGIKKASSFADNPLQKQSVAFSCISAALFLAVIVLMRFIAPVEIGAGFITVAFQAFLPQPVLYNTRKNIVWRLLSLFTGLVPAVISLIVFSLPLTIGSYTYGLNAALGIVALLCGVAVRHLSAYITKLLVK